MGLSPKKFRVLGEVALVCRQKCSVYFGKGLPHQNATLAPRSYSGKNMNLISAANPWYSTVFLYKVDSCISKYTNVPVSFETGCLNRLCPKYGFLEYLIVSDIINCLITP